MRNFVRTGTWSFLFYEGWVWKKFSPYIQTFMAYESRFLLFTRWQSLTPSAPGSRCLEIPTSAANLNLAPQCSSKIVIQSLREEVLKIQFSSVQFSRSVVSDSLLPHESQHARPPCPLQTPGVYSNSCLSSRWCHPAISSSVVPFSSCPQSLPASGSFPKGQLFAWGGQSIGVSASASVLPMNT